jgi:dihydrofolate reductase
MGRRLYEAMLYWENIEEASLTPDHLKFAQLWKALPKVACSTTLEHVEGNTKLVRDSVADEISKLKKLPGKDIAIGGASLARSCAELIDEWRMFVSPVILGAGTPYFPPLDEKIKLELLETRTFASRIVYLRYKRIHLKI